MGGARPHRLKDKPFFFSSSPALFFFCESLLGTDETQAWKESQHDVADRHERKTPSADAIASSCRLQHNRQWARKKKEGPPLPPSSRSSKQQHRCRRTCPCTRREIQLRCLPTFRPIPDFKLYTYSHRSFHVPSCQLAAFVCWFAASSFQGTFLSNTQASNCARKNCRRRCRLFESRQGRRFAKKLHKRLRNECYKKKE